VAVFGFIAKAPGYRESSCPPREAPFSVEHARNVRAGTSSYVCPGPAKSTVMQPFVARRRRSRLQELASADAVFPRRREGACNDTSSGAHAPRRNSSDASVPPCLNCPIALRQTALQNHCKWTRIHHDAVGCFHFARRECTKGPRLLQNTTYEAGRGTASCARPWSNFHESTVGRMPRSGR